MIIRNLASSDQCLVLYFFLSAVTNYFFRSKELRSAFIFLAYKTIAIPGLQPGRSTGPAVLNSDRIEIFESIQMRCDNLSDSDAMVMSAQYGCTLMLPYINI